MQVYGNFNECSMTGKRCIRAFAVRDQTDLQQITAQLELFRALTELPQGVLVDAHVPGMHGGTGQTAPWQLLAGFDPGVPVILAGGLTPENVAEAIRMVRPYAVDVASGVESSPGKKDADKLVRFIAAVRGACG
jgi:phosphoribosylanthranilate isomerase